MSGDSKGICNCNGKGRDDGKEFHWLNPINLPVFLISCYRTIISPWLPRCCRFEPSCSAYALEALKKRGLFVGLWLTFRRLLRCQPFCRGGLDLVPEKPVKKK